MAFGDDYTEPIELAAHKLGDRWIGISKIGPVTINESQPANTLTRIRWFFRLNGSVYKMDSDPGADATIVIDDATTWEAHVDEVQDFLPKAGIWQWDSEFYETGASSPLTLYKGRIKVFDDVTR